VYSVKSQRTCIRLDGRLDTAHYGLTIADVTQGSFAWRQIWGRDELALYIEHLLERRHPLWLSRTLYIWFGSWLKSTFRWYTHPTFLSSAYLANLAVLLSLRVCVFCLVNPHAPCSPWLHSIFPALGIYIYIHIYIYMYIYLCRYICVYVYIYVYHTATQALYSRAANVLFRSDPHYYFFWNRVCLSTEL